MLDAPLTPTVLIDAEFPAAKAGASFATIARKRAATKRPMNFFTFSPDIDFVILRRM
jgi:hypothetical protein